MSQPLRSQPFFAARLLVALGCIAAAAALPGSGLEPQAEPAPAAQAHASMAHGGMAHMAGHMYLTTLRPVQPGDREKADAIVAAAKTAMAPYQDYRKALADGYQIFLPNVPQPQYHFTKAEYGRAAWTALRSPQADIAALHQDSGRRLQAGGRHVHRPRRRQ